MIRNASFILATWALAQSANAFSIQFDYSQDTAGFFTAERRTTLAATGAYISSFLGDTRMTSIQSEPAANGYGQNTAGVTFTPPSNTVGSAITLTNYSIAADTVVIFVGGESRAGGANAIRTQAGYSPVVSYYDDSFADRMSNRGNPKPSVWGGMISFNTNTIWYADQDITTAEPLRDAEYTFSLGEDLFTYAQYGILQVLNSINLDPSYISSGRYRGPSALELDANGFPVSGGKVSYTYESTIAGSLFEGNEQRILGGSAVELGERKYITEADLALLRDAGYATTSSVPEPATYALLSGFLAGACILARRVKRAK